MENLALSTEQPTNSQRRHDAPASAERNRGEAVEKPWRNQGEIRRIEDSESCSRLAVGATVSQRVAFGMRDEPQSP